MASTEIHAADDIEGELPEDDAFFGDGAPEHLGDGETIEIELSDNEEDHAPR